MSLEELGALVGIVAFGVPIFGWLLRRITRRLSPEEKEILKACAEDGEIQVLRSDIHGDWVRAGKSDFFDQKDPAHAAKFMEAFQTLLRRGLATHQGGILYQLTGTGFTLARKIRGVKLVSPSDRRAEPPCLHAVYFHADPIRDSA